jgi:hypothetical protein
VLKLHGGTSDEAGACRNVPTFCQSKMTSDFVLQTRILDESSVLSLRGILVDQIMLVGPVFTRALMSDPSALAEAIRWGVTHGLRHNTVANLQMADLALCLTCGSNMTNRDAELDPTHAQTFELYLQHLPSRPNGGLRHEIQRRLPYSWREGKPPPSDYWHHLWGKAMNRRFFVTRLGMIGMGPPETKADDRVCMLYGGEMPFLLRPRGPDFELVGDAYVRARGVSCNGKTWSAAREQHATAGDGHCNGLAAAASQAGGADQWFEIV